LQREGEREARSEEAKRVEDVTAAAAEDLLVGGAVQKHCVDDGRVSLEHVNRYTLA
jgi:hypothetical protein